MQRLKERAAGSAIWSRLLLGATTVALTATLANAGYCKGKPDDTGPPEGVGGPSDNSNGNGPSDNPGGGPPDNPGNGNGPPDNPGNGNGPPDNPGNGNGPPDFVGNNGNNGHGGGPPLEFLYDKIANNEHMRNGLENADKHRPPWAQNEHSPLWQAYEEYVEQQLANGSESVDLNFDNNNGDESDPKKKAKLKALFTALGKTDADNSVKNIPAVLEEVASTEEPKNEAVAGTEAPKAEEVASTETPKAEVASTEDKNAEPVG